MTPPAPSTVLVVDDDPSIRAALARLLARSGYTPVVAASLREAACRLAECRATLSVVIVDLALGEESGLSLVRHLQRRYPSLPVVVFSAAGDRLGEQEVGLPGVSECLTKPATPESIVGAVRRALATAHSA
jgi:DNA-binding NtrC family response regulator